jgi:hypothetical protein
MKVDFLLHVHSLNITKGDKPSNLRYKLVLKEFTLIKKDGVVAFLCQ